MELVKGVELAMALASVSLVTMVMILLELISELANEQEFGPSHNLDVYVPIAHNCLRLLMER